MPHDWQILDRLRARFLAPASDAQAYWQSSADLAQYDATYAQRIAWKWQAVFRALCVRKRLPTSCRLLDWGCGSGVAHRALLAELPPDQVTHLDLYDHSPLATEYAGQVAAKKYPNIKINLLRNPPDKLPPDTTLLASHIINELPESVIGQFLDLAAGAQSVLWLEPGTHSDSRALLAVREKLLATHTPLAPCAHSGTCPMRSDENARHWCHHFAAPPPALAADSQWALFARRAGIDLRSLPYSYLAFEKKHSPEEQPEAGRGQLHRLVGRPRFYKAHATLLTCGAEGLQTLELHKRGNPAAFKQLSKLNEHPLYEITYEGEKISAIAPAEF